MEFFALKKGKFLVVFPEGIEHSWAWTNFTITRNEDGNLLLMFNLNNRLVMGIKTESDKVTHSFHTDGTDGSSVMILDTDGDGMPDLKTVSKDGKVEWYKGSVANFWVLQKEYPYKSSNND